MQWSDIKDWEASTLSDEYDALSSKERKADDWGHEVISLNDNVTWEGEARDAAEPAARRRERLGARVADRREPRCRDVPLECPGVDEARTARPDHAYANGHGNLL